MLNNGQVRAVIDAIEELPGKDRPQLVLKLFLRATLRMRHDTGEVMLTAYELAEECRCAPSHLSEAASVLVRLGVFLRSYETIPGMKGRRVVYAVNPHVAWKGSAVTRNTACAEEEPPMLKLMDGGKAARPKGTLVTLASK